MIFINNRFINKGNKAAPFIVNWDNRFARDMLLGNEAGYIYLLKGINGVGPLILRR